MNRRNLLHRAAVLAVSAVSGGLAVKCNIDHEAQAAEPVPVAPAVPPQGEFDRLMAKVREHVKKGDGKTIGDIHAIAQDRFEAAQAARSKMAAQYESDYAYLQGQSWGEPSRIAKLREMRDRCQKGREGEIAALHETLASTPNTFDAAEFARLTAPGSVYEGIGAV